MDVSDINQEHRCRVAGEELRQFGDKIDIDYRRERELIDGLDRVILPYFERDNVNSVINQCILLTHCTLNVYFALSILRDCFKS